MCGITGCVTDGTVLETLLTGLQNLEYRGYDSAGVAVQNGSGIAIRKGAGEVSDLADGLREATPDGPVGIGHTRWSTHGSPSDENAHPHTDCTGDVAVVHNGIIENYDALREELQAAGHVFTSETDTEVVPHLVERYLARGESPAGAFRSAVDHLEGSYAIAALVDGAEGVYATRSGSPLVLGIADGACYLASDVPAFLEFTDDVVYLEDGDIAEVGPGGYDLVDGEGYRVDRPVQTVDWVPEDAEKGGYDHYMLKEIHEQPAALRQTVRGRADPDGGRVQFENLPAGAFGTVDRVVFVACGTSYHAALYASTLLERRGVPARAVRASEFTGQPATLGDDTLVVGVTQSGETADTLGALRRAHQCGLETLAVTNVVGSTAARECDRALFIRAGPEIGVAATKTFSSQVVTLLLLAERLAVDTGTGHSEDLQGLLHAVQTLPETVQRTLDTSDAREVARTYQHSDAYFFIGRGSAYSVALEGALKLKEITYEHAEGFAAGELKHGPLALVTPETPVIAVFTGEHEERMLSNVEEVRARGAPVVAVAPADIDGVADLADHVLSVPPTHPEVVGILGNVQLQLLAYRTATLLDRPIDKPRNLAKSVTVE